MSENNECLHRYVSPFGNGLYACNCGAFGSASDFQIDERVAELVELEREIGRAMIGYLIIENDYERMSDAIHDKVFQNMARRMTELELEQARLFVQWRKLHAEGDAGGGQ